MICVGLDLSVTATGMVAIDEDDPFSGVQSWIIRPEKSMLSDPILKKMSIARQIAVILIRPGISKPIVGIEGYSYSKFGMAESGELGGIVKAELMCVNFEYSIFPPTSIKKFACGSGSAKKELMIAAVFKRWTFDTNDNNLADAFAIAKLAQAMYWRKEGSANLHHLTSFQFDVVENLFKPKPKKVKK